MTNPGGPKKKPEVPPEHTFDSMRFHQVVVISGGFLYRGMLLGVDDSDVYLKGQFRYLVLPLERVTSIRLADDKEGFNPRKSVAPAFYSESD